MTLFNILPLYDMGQREGRNLKFILLLHASKMLLSFSLFNIQNSYIYSTPCKLWRILQERIKNDIRILRNNDNLSDASGYLLFNATDTNNTFGSENDTFQTPALINSFYYSPDSSYTIIIDPETESTDAGENDVDFIHERVRLTEALLWCLGTLCLALTFCYMNRERIFRVKNKFRQPQNNLIKRRKFLSQWSTHSNVNKNVN